MKAFCDFDGTISKRDVSDAVFEQFALPAWHDAEERWEQGLISARQCMKAQVNLLSTSQAALDTFLDSLEIDESFLEFQRFCRKHDIPIVIVSDGVDYFIRRILANHGVSEVEIIANRFIRTHEGGRDRFDLTFPFSSDHCGPRSGVCKCRIIEQANGSHIYVGDGRSDFCVSHEAQLVFAKAKLITYCEENRIPYVPYGTFHDVVTTLRSLTLNNPVLTQQRFRSTTA